MCGTNAGSQLKLANGVSVGTKTGGAGSVTLQVNQGNIPRETSDFAIAEVVVWNRGLSDTEMHAASGYLMNKLGGPNVDLTDPVHGSCQDDEKTLATAFVLANMNHANFTFGNDNSGCLRFCQSLPSYASQTGMMIKHEGLRAEFSDNAASVKSCTCVYPNNNRPSDKMLPNYATPSAPAFTITNSDGMALGIRPKIDCDSEDDLDIETQLSDPNNLRQQFQLTLDGQIVSVRCPKKVLTADCNGNAVSLQVPEVSSSNCIIGCETFFAHPCCSLACETS